MELSDKQKNKLLKLAEIADKGEFAIVEELDTLEEKIDITRETLESEITSTKEEFDKKLSEIQLKKGDKGDTPKVGIDFEQPKNGEDYILTEQDKEEIAKSVTVPVVEKIVVEKTETIIEKPIVTEITKINEVAKYETPDEATNRINRGQILIKKERVEGLTDIEHNLKHNLYTGISEARARELITIYGGGTIGGSPGDILYNNNGVMGGFGDWNGSTLNIGSAQFVSGGVTTTGIFNQSGDGATFDVGGSSFKVLTLAYSSGLLVADNTDGFASLGDWFGHVNNTSVVVKDSLGIVEYIAINGHFFTGQVATGAGTSTATGLTNVPLTVTNTIDGYVGVQVQNLSSGGSASQDYIVANDIDDGTIATGHYADFGYNGSAYNPATSPFAAFSQPNDAYLYTVGGNLVIGTATTGKNIDFFTGGLDLSNRRMRITSSGSVGFGTVAPNNFLSIAPPRYLTGTASQSGTTVTGVGTTWTSAMIGNLFEFDDGTTAGVITARASNTSLTVSISQTVASQTYSIHYPGIEVTKTGLIGINQINPTSQIEIASNNLGSTANSASGLAVTNNTPASLGAQQISPGIRLRGYGFATTPGTSQSVDWYLDHLPVQGTSAPTSFLNFKVSINGGAYTTPFSLSSAGSITFSGQIQASNVISTGLIASTSTTANANFETFSSTAGITTAQALNGSANTQSRTRMGGSANPVIIANNSFANLFIQGTNVTEGTSGTHPLMASVAIRPLAITNGTATTTATATLYIESAATGTTPAQNDALWIGSGSSRFSGRVLQAKGANIASANDLTLGADGNTFTITGNTQLNAIITAGWSAGSFVTLIFTGTPTVKHNTAGGAGTAVLFLAGSVDLAAANNTVLTLVYDGTQWQETARKIA